MLRKLLKFTHFCLNSLSNAFFWLSHKLVIPLRYKVEVKGSEYLRPKKGIEYPATLFLANHSSHLDGTLLSVVLIENKVPFSVWALDMTFKLPYLRWAARHKDILKVVKVPNIPERRSEKHQSNLHKLVNRTADGLKRGHNFVIFPSGKVKKTPLEIIEGKSAVPLIIKQCPDIRIILVRITGMWGSRFSCATKLEHRWATHSIKAATMFWQSLKMILMNGIFFIPKRKVLVEFIPAPPDFPKHGTRLEIDTYLENFYNSAWGPKGEPLHRVPDYFWKPEYIEHEYLIREYHFDLGQVPKPIRNEVVKIIADKADLDSKDIEFNMHLGREIGLDSLDLVEILASLEKEFHIKKMVPEDLTTVGHLIAIAAKIPIVCEVKSGTFHEESAPNAPTKSAP